MNRLRKIRIAAAVVFLTLLTLLFLDFTGTLHGWLGWMVKVQFVPAVLALNACIVAALVVLTLLFGRLYCSVICPLGVFQDVVARLHHKKHKYSYSPAIGWLRFEVLCVFILAFVAGIGSLVALLDPYSAYGRIASNIFSPLYIYVNNLLAFFSERIDSYAFYEKEVWLKGIGTLLIAAATFVIIGILSWRGGRTYCNTVCPVGTVLGFVSRFSLYKIKIDTSKCNSCGLCARNCKASCINPKEHAVDYSRCVACFDCIDKCNKGAISYVRRVKESTAEQPKEQPTDTSRRRMMTIGALTIAGTALRAQEKKVDGGLAFIEDKKIPQRQTPIAPAGAQSLSNFTNRCTACQLCVSACPNDVLRPSTNLDGFMQPEVSYERGYCRPECTRCSEVCPAGAITTITKEEKSSIQTGHAVWIEKNCVVNTNSVECGNCARHCPAGAITMVAKNPSNPHDLKIPAVNIERCIGCGACENLCPSRPFSAIYVEGHNIHRVL